MKGKSSESIPSVQSLVWRPMESMFGQQAEEQEDSSAALLIQEWLFISDLFKDIQDAILLILHWRTMLWFRANSFQKYLPYWMCVQPSFYHQLWIDNLEVRIRARDRQYSSCPLILETKVTRILTMFDLNVPRHAPYLHNAGKRHQDAVYWVDIEPCYWEKD